MELQLLNNGLDSSGVLYGMCLKWFKIKHTSEICFGLVFVEMALFWAEVGVFVLKGVWEAWKSCFRLGVIYWGCLKCSQDLVLTDAQVMFTFASWLVFEAKVEMTKAKVVQASSRYAYGWWDFPEVCGCCLYQEIRSNAQDKQNCKKCALWKWYCNLFAIFGIILCVMLHSSEQCQYPLYLH